MFQILSLTSLMIFDGEREFFCTPFYVVVVVGLFSWCSVIVPIMKFLSFPLLSFTTVGLYSSKHTQCVSML